MKWVTRSHVHVDRVACPWLIKRFVDSEAEFMFVPSNQVAQVDERKNAIPFDAWSWDRPLPFLAKEFQETGDPRVIWEAHFAGIESSYCHMEKMTNLSAIDRPYGFTICCFPIKIKGASAGWVRPVAIIEED